MKAKPRGSPGSETSANCWIAAAASLGAHWLVKDSKHILRTSMAISLVGWSTTSRAHHTAHCASQVGRSGKAVSAATAKSLPAPETWPKALVAAART
eukprot:CAMPEP_0115528520 /NCGR_PEP_ID=MMETSP0271-20121206/83439_1 /TAXON_ID=71861 /ORGANISM="Scrippsiella trochoidea, Strain CCMP3099" /LENGTH=96 /DNA_ID=CAMNT_0002960455 /DNA_START=161 /DNA_END=448 /DNA_ORIENTATION=-